jgi:hypothetical protein
VTIEADLVTGNHELEDDEADERQSESDEDGERPGWAAYAVQTAVNGGSEVLIFAVPRAGDSTLQLSQKAWRPTS